MPVIINEFEVVADAPEPATPVATPRREDKQAPPAPPLSAVDIIAIHEHYERRMARLAAD